MNLYTKSELAYLDTNLIFDLAGVCSCPLLLADLTGALMLGAKHSGTDPINEKVMEGQRS